MKSSEYDELRAAVAKQEKQPLGGPWRPDVVDKAAEPPSLHKFAFSIQSMLSRGLIEDQKMEMDWTIDKELEYIALQFRSWLYGEAIDDTYTVYFPANWFQHLKQRVLPGAIIRYWPVRKRAHRIEIRALYPDLRKKLHFPDEENLIHVIHKEE